MSAPWTRVAYDGDYDIKKCAYLDIFKYNIDKPILNCEWAEMSAMWH